MMRLPGWFRRVSRRRAGKAGAQAHPVVPFALLLLLVAAGPASSAAGAPARRIVTLAPHLAELVYAAGAGDHLVGVVEFSDFPPAVATLPKVGDAFRVDYEAVLALRPDLVLAWSSGNPPEVLARLRALGFRVHAVEAVQLEDIGKHISAIGALTGTAAVADRAAGEFARRLAQLRALPDPRVHPRVFVQLTESPYFTVTDRHFIGQGLRICGARNVFGELPGLTAVVSLESIIEAAPQVIIVSDMGPATRRMLDDWRRWQALPAVRGGRLHGIDADLLSRPAGRILDGIEALCAVLRSR